MSSEWLAHGWYICCYPSFPDKESKLIGHYQENGLAISIFGAYLLLDALLSTIPRIVIPIFALSRAPELCLPPDSLAYRSGTSSSASHPYTGAPDANTQSLMANPGGNLLARSQGTQIWSRRLGEVGFSPSDCLGISTLIEVTICILVLTAAVLQIRSAMLVRAYARRLNTKRRRDAIRAKIADDQQTVDVELTVEVADNEANGDVPIDEETGPHLEGRPRTFAGEFQRDVMRWFR